MDALTHSKNSVKKYGGKIEDYIELHKFMDLSKDFVADYRHRLFLHNTMGITILSKVFGDYIHNSNGDSIYVRYIGEDHVLEDLGRIPTISDLLGYLPLETLVGLSTPAIAHKKASEKKVKQIPSEPKDVWTIVEVGWEYDDNWYTRSEYGGIPKYYDTSEEAIKAKCDEKNIEWIKSKSDRLYEYVSGQGSWNLDIKELSSLFGKQFIKEDFDSYSCSLLNKIPAGFTDEQYLRLSKALNLVGYEVAKVSNLSKAP